MRRPAEGLATAAVRPAPGGAKTAPKKDRSANDGRPRRVTPAQRGQGRPLG
jgi:hypothetical protein